MSGDLFTAFISSLAYRDVPHDAHEFFWRPSSPTSSPIIGVVHLEIPGRRYFFYGNLLEGALDKDVSGFGCVIKRIIACSLRVRPTGPRGNGSCHFYYF